MGKAKRKKVMGTEEQHARAAVAGMDAAEAVKARTDWAGSYQSEPVRGIPGDAPGNRPQPRHAQIAMGHSPSDPRVVGAPMQQLDYQPELYPVQGAEIASVAGSPGPLARSVESHQQLVMMNHADASQPHLMGQLRNPPMGATGAPRDMPVGTAGLGHGQSTGPAPRPEVPPKPGHVIDAHTRPWGDRTLPRGTHVPGESKAPGSEYTSPVPGNHR